MIGKKNGENAFLEPEVSRGDALMLYKHLNSYTVRICLKMDQMIDPDQMRTALDLTAKRYPYFCVALKKNDAGYYYEANDAPIALLHTSGSVTLNAEETNGHIWAVCYENDRLYFNIYHGRTDSVGSYALLSTLLYYYLTGRGEILDPAGILTGDTPFSEAEIHDPLKDLPLIDSGRIRRPPAPLASNLMDSQNLKPADHKGFIFRAMIPEEVFVPFSKEHNASPGIMLSTLMARAAGRLQPDLQRPVTCSYVLNARPMLHAEKSFHNCVSTILLKYDEEVKGMPLDQQAALFRENTLLQANENLVLLAMTITASKAQRLLDLPGIDEKVQFARESILETTKATSFSVSYAGKWKYPQLGRWIRELWVETSSVTFPLIELSAVNGQLFVSFMQSFEERIYFDALLAEFKEQGIPYTEFGAARIQNADIVM